MKPELWLIAGGVLVLAGTVLHSYLLGALGLLMLCVIGIAWLWARYCFARVSYRRSLSADRVYAGEQVELEVSLTNAKPLALPWVRVSDRLDIQFRVHDPDAEEHFGREWEIRRQLSVSWFERVRWRYVVDCPRRGYHRIGPAVLKSGDPFGFFVRDLELSETQGVLVYPRLLSMEEVPLSQRFPFEGTTRSRTALPDPMSPVGAREYREGDTWRQVHWRASAKLARLHSKVWMPTTEANVLLFLDLNSRQHVYGGIDVDAIEHAISAASTLAHRIHSARWGLGLYVNGIQPGARHRVRIGVARGDDAFAAVMEVLARVPPYPVMRFEQLLRMERHSIPWGVTVLAITAAPNQEIRDQISLYRRTGIRADLLDTSELAGEPAPVLNGVVA